MYYTYLPHVAYHIARTHRLFGGRRATSDNVRALMGKAHGRMLMSDNYKPVTFKAWTDSDHGNLHTEVTIRKLFDKHGNPCGWDVTERRIS